MMHVEACGIPMMAGSHLSGVSLHSCSALSPALDSLASRGQTACCSSYLYMEARADCCPTTAMPLYRDVCLRSEPVAYGIGAAGIDCPVWLSSKGFGQLSMPSMPSLTPLAA